MYAELERYKRGLAEYIEATYHISHPKLVQVRAELLRADRAIAQRPYLESTPRYRAERQFADLDVARPIRDILSLLGRSGLAFDPPYEHQAQALEAVLRHGKDLLVTTGTGSGKTETFLLPLLGRLYQEAVERPVSFERRGIRALILYPMNALVNDQLNRLRLLFGGLPVVEAFRAAAGRPAKFARYTGRSLFAGELPRKGDNNASDKLRRKLRPMAFYLDLLKAAEGQGEASDQAGKLIGLLKKQGRWPAKRDLRGWYQGHASGHWFDKDGALARTIEDEDWDAELYLRHEVQAAPPDLLMTNYSMLEYMLLRPIERSIWATSRARFEENPDEKLLLVLDEAHLYRGAAGVEVSLLLRRLYQRLGLTAGRVQVICTSASFEDGERALDFVGRLSGRPRDGFVRLVGERRAWSPSGPGAAADAERLSRVNLPAFLSEDPRARAAAIAPVLDPEASGASIVRTGSTAHATRLWALDARGAVREVELPAGADGVPGDWLAVVDATATAGPFEVGIEGQPASLRVSDEGVTRLSDPLQRPLYEALVRWPVIGRLLNITSTTFTTEDEATRSGGAQEIGVLAGRLFPEGPDATRRAATDALIELACVARGPDGRPILAARAHAFFRGLPGLWACLDPQCSALPAELRNGPTGQVYAQPVGRCSCGARVLELVTCRGCGAAFARAYAEDVRYPKLLWMEPGERVTADAPALSPIDLLLEGPAAGARAEWMDALSGRVGASRGRPREVWLAPFAPLPQHGEKPREPGRFRACPRCGEDGEKISEHPTGGDQPFQELVSTQLLTQPPRPDSATPLKGRKVMIFSDGRQKASRLSGNLRAFSLRDAIRPLLMVGLRALRDELKLPTTLDHAYLALLVGCVQRKVALPTAEAVRGRLDVHMSQARALIAADFVGDRTRSAEQVSRTIGAEIPLEVLQELYGVLFQHYTGVEALGLASFAAVVPEIARSSLAKLDAPVATGVSPPDARAALLDRWIQLAARARMIVIPTTPGDKIAGDRGALVYRKSGTFQDPLKAELGGSFFRKNMGRTGAWSAWIERSLSGIGGATADGMVIDGSHVRVLLADEVHFARCRRCTRVQVRSPLTGHCIGCGAGPLEALDAATDGRFRARSAYYRRVTEAALLDPELSPHPFVSAEHSAQIGQTMEGKLFARTEEYELRFQDVPLPFQVAPDGEEGDGTQGPIDVLSCTTTMEVGVDIGSLTGVALRNVPPGRANYQQRAGRARRRGSALATVITYAGADAHDQRFFDQPAEMVGGPVRDPVLKLDNLEIVRRQCFALILSLFQLDRVDDDAEGRAQLFESLGTLAAFQTGGPDGFSFAGLAAWLEEEQDRVLAAIEEIAPMELAERDAEIERMPELLLERLRTAGAGPKGEDAGEEDTPSARVVKDEERRAGVHLQMEPELDDLAGAPRPEPGTDRRREDEEAALSEDLLLDRLFAKAVLPRYAFPTDVVSFYVFDKEGSSRFGGPQLRYSPQQGLSMALGQYAPGQEVWVDGLKWHSMAIWTPYRRDLARAWRRQQLYQECEDCHYARTVLRGDGVEVGDPGDCPACGKPGGLRPAMRWFSPPGFAHPVDLEAELPGAVDPPKTRPTRAKLSAPFDGAAKPALRQEGSVTLWESREDLIITNAGTDDPDSPGFRYCLRCGRAEPAGWPDGKIRAGGHPRPTPARRGESPTCEGAVTSVTLGCSFHTDICLFRLRLNGGAALPPGSPVANIALTSVAEAIAAAARDALQLDAGEVAAEHRPAQTALGKRGEEVEIYLYDAVPGGAGYSGAAARLEQPSLLRRALAILEGCKGAASADGVGEQGCARSCYACLRSYQNRWLHGSLDRHLAADLLRHCLDGVPPQVTPERAGAHLAEMAAWLHEEGVAAEVDGAILRVGGTPVVLSHPFTPEVAPPGVRAVSLLIAQRALPDACVLARGATLPTRRAAEVVPPGPEDANGTPAFLPEQLIGGLAAAKALGPYRVAAATPGDLLVRLDTPAMERGEVNGRPLVEGTWLIVRPGVIPEPELTRGVLAMITCSSRAFHATSARWTVGQVTVRPGEGAPRLSLRYLSKRATARPETVARADATIIGMVVGVVG